MSQVLLEFSSLFQRFLSNNPWTHEPLRATLFGLHPGRKALQTTGLVSRQACWVPGAKRRMVAAAEWAQPSRSAAALVAARRVG